MQILVNEHAGALLDDRAGRIGVVDRGSLDRSVLQRTPSFGSASADEALPT